MNKQLFRACLVELIATFGLVYIASGVVCGNFLTTPQGSDPRPGLTQFGNQPGLVGIALANGFIYAALLAVTLPVSGGFLNPAVTLMLWVFNRIDTKRMSWLIACQLLGGLLAAIALRFTFDIPVLREARLGAPHLDAFAYPQVHYGAILGGTLIELTLTFFLVFAIFGGLMDGGRTTAAALPAGLVVTAATLMAYYLTGASLNPARWLGPALIEYSLPDPKGSPIADVFAYVAGPVVGALLGGMVCFKLLGPSPATRSAPAEPAMSTSEAIKVGRGKR